jgi:hypothetical protein
MYGQYIVLGIYYLFGLSYFIFKDYKYAKNIMDNKTYISLNNENHILDNLIDEQNAFQ